MAGTVWAVVVAGGTGSRFGGPKQFESLAGRPVVEWSVTAARKATDGVVLVVPAGEVERARSLGADVVVAGGSTRSASVRLGLARVPESAEVIVVHDAARPLASPALFAAVVAPLLEDALDHRQGRHDRNDNRGKDGQEAADDDAHDDAHDVAHDDAHSDVGATGADIKLAVDAVGSVDAVVCALPVADTLKRVDVDRSTVTETVDRSSLVAVQTPQAFRAAVLRRAHARGGDATDDAALVEAIGGTVRVVPGEAHNVKLTLPSDLTLLEHLVDGGGW